MRLIGKNCFSWLGVMVLLAGLGMVSVSSLSSAVTIGETYGGGIVFDVDESGQHGLIAAKADMPGHSSGSQEGWFTWFDAKRICNDFVFAGYSDWFLPSREQLNKLYLQQGVVGGFAENYYWSSSEQSADVAWNQNFFVSDQYKYYKNNVSQVRPVRAF